MNGLNANAKTQAMMLLKMACNGGATAEALAAIHACSAQRAGENAVDWQGAVTQLKTLVAKLPAANFAVDASLGLDLEEEEEDEEDELAA
ncbi:MAG: hypothetical protein IT492_03235 [Gammaproteobacteria bacterium]|nr:hypothetical protein [Gammaproteobacteria bacterium]